MGFSEVNGRLISSGEGIETEAVHAAFKQYTDDPTRWFTLCAGDFSTIATTAATVAEHVSQDRLNDLGVLGALVALNLIHGYPTLPLNPLLIHYLIHDGDIECLTMEMVSKWFPDLKHLLSCWLGMTHQDPLDAEIFTSHFSTYHDLQV